MSILLLSVKQRLMQDMPALTDADFSHHASDLYVMAYPAVLAWLRANYEWHRSITTFTDNLSGKLMLDIPFAYDQERDGACDAPLCNHI